MSASTIDQKYFELVALADRLSGVSKQLKGKLGFVSWRNLKSWKSTENFLKNHKFDFLHKFFIIMILVIF